MSSNDIEHILSIIEHCPIVCNNFTDETIDMSDHDPVYIGAIHDGSGFNPCFSLFIAEREHEAVEESFTELEEWSKDRMTKEELEESFEIEEKEGYNPITGTFDGRVLCLTKVEIQKLYNESELFGKLDLYYENLVEEMFESFVETALWSTPVCDENGNHIGNLDDRYDIYALTKSAYDEYWADCLGFIVENYSILSKMYEKNGNWNMDRIGHDFSLTRDGHGAGFWDGHPIYLNYGDLLTKSAKNYGSVEIDQKIDYEKYPLGDLSKW